MDWNIYFLLAFIKNFVNKCWFWGIVSFGLGFLTLCNISSLSENSELIEALKYNKKKKIIDKYISKFNHNKSLNHKMNALFVSLNDQNKVLTIKSFRSHEFKEKIFYKGKSANADSGPGFADKKRQIRVNSDFPNSAVTRKYGK